jgi:toxin ParE1/3/4
MRDDLAPGIRTTGFERRATIYFKLVEDRVIILGIFYGGRRFAPSIER